MCHMRNLNPVMQLKHMMELHISKFILYGVCQFNQHEHILARCVGFVVTCQLTCLSHSKFMHKGLALSDLQVANADCNTGTLHCFLGELTV